MKSVIIVLAIAVVAISANPINRKWGEIRGLVYGIKVDVGNAVADIKQASFCHVCNPQIGQQITAYLDEKAPEALVIFEQVYAEIETESLTYQQAEKYFTQLETLLNEIKDDLRNAVSQLPQQAQQTIKNILDNSTDAIRQKKEKIFNLLSLKRSAVATPHWERIRRSRSKIHADFQLASIDVRKIAIRGDYEVGHQISDYLIEKETEAIDIIVKMREELNYGYETLTHSKAVTYFTQLETIFNKAKNDLGNLITQLPIGSQRQIKKVVEDAMKSIKENVDIILTLLTTRYSY